MFGAGIGYSFTDSLGVRVERERFNDVADADIDLITGGIVYSF